MFIRKKMASDNSIGEDIAVIKEKITNLSKSFDDFKEDSKALSRRVDTVETTSTRVSERVSGLALFQSAFSIVIGAIAAYLGVKRGS
jgi:archaellum component FlaC